jgi:hypothetical protein
MVDTSTHHLSAFGHHVTIGTGFPIYEGGEEGLLPSVNILRFHHSTLASTIQTTFSKVSTDLIPAAPLWLRDTDGRPSSCLVLATTQAYMRSTPTPMTGTSSTKNQREVSGTRMLGRWCTRRQQGKR